MNKIYRIIWSKVTGDYCVVGEIAKNGGKGKNNSSVSQARKISKVMEQNFSVKVIAKNIAAIFLLCVLTDAAWAGYVINCPGSTVTNDWIWQGMGSGMTSVAASSVNSGEVTCGSTSAPGGGVVLSESPNGVSGGTYAYLQVGQAGTGGSRAC